MREREKRRGGEKEKDKGKRKRKKRKGRGEKRKRGGGRPFSRNDENGGGWLQDARGWEGKTVRGFLGFWVRWAWARFLGYSLAIFKTFYFAK